MREASSQREFLVVLLLLAAGPAPAQKRGGVLKMYTIDSPASMSIQE